MYISQISQNENFCEDCTCEVATLGVRGCGFILISQKKLIPKIAAISKFTKYTPLENNSLYGIRIYMYNYTVPESMEKVKTSFPEV